MPIAQQMVLKEGVRKLIQMGIDGKGSAKNGYINEKDIRAVFAGFVLLLMINALYDNMNLIPIP